MEEYIKDCLESIIHSIAKDGSVEVICIDDGSTDNSGFICSEYANKYSCITYIKKNNEGVSKTRNFGVYIAKGEYISFIDADDLVHPDYIGVALTAIREMSFDICFFEYEDLPQKQNNFEIIRSDRAALFTGHDTGRMVYDRMLRSNIHLSNVWSAIYKKNFLVRNEISFNNSWISSEDVDFINACLSRAESVCYINQSSVIYRRYREGSATNNMNNYKILCDLQVRMKWFEYVTEEHIGDISYYPNEFVDIMMSTELKQPYGITILEYVKKHRYILYKANSKKALIFKKLSVIFGERISLLITKAIVNMTKKRN